MGGIGIVNNPRSLRNHRRPALADRLRERLGRDGEVVDASTPEELDRAVARLKAARIDLLGVNGGDGTGHHVMTAFARAYGDEPLPRLLLLRGGAMNTVAHGQGITGGPEAILRDVLARRRKGLPLRTVDRDLLRIEADGEPARFGFIFGTGVVVTFLEAYYATGRPTPLTAAGLVAQAAGSALVGGAFATALMRRDRLRVETDGEEWPDGAYLTLLAGATPDIGFGFRAFPRCDEQPGFFHAVGVTASPLQLVFALPRIHAGRPWRRRHALDEVARELVLEAHRPRYTIDGDLYEARRRVRVATGPAVEIVLP
ncbi:MAG: diacylglycerol kinase family protein [Anaeromyxobacter sp.]